MTKLDQIERQFQAEWNYREPSNIPQTGGKEVERCELCGCPVVATDEARRGHWDRVHRGQRRNGSGGAR